MKRTSKKKYSIILFTLILALGVIAGAYALLSDTVTLNATATVSEANSASLEIVSANCDVWLDVDDTGTWQPTFTISEDKKTATLNIGEIIVDENGKITSVGGYDFTAIDRDYIQTENTITVKNTGNVPVKISFTTTDNGLTLIQNCSPDDSIENEILAAGATCTFALDCDSLEGATYTAGTNLTASFTVEGTEYTGTEEARISHTHGRISGY